jgi:hypothetical protein
VTTTLEEAKQWLRDHVEDGAKCPCCTRLAKVYHRHINSSMARDMIAMYVTHGTDWAYLPAVRKGTSSRDNREEPKLRYWGLVEEEKVRRPDGGRAGWWRITEKGEAFLLDQITVPRKMRVFDKRSLGPLAGTEQVSIRDCLGDHFNYEDLMAG